MTTTYTKAIELNSEGVALMTARNYSSARLKFKKAIELFKDYKVAVDTRKRPLTRSTPSVDFSWSDCINYRSIPLQHSAPQCFIYARPLLILSTSEFPDSVECHAETAAVLYNIGLSFHLEGHSSNHSSSLLSRAMKAYKMALKFRKRGNSWGKLRGDRLLNVAIHNNMAMIHQEFMDNSAARTCFITVSRGLHALGQSGFLEHNEYQGVFMNLMMGAQSQNTSAAAA